MRKPVTPRIDDAAGIVQLTTVPSGATMRNGLNMPAVLGISSRIMLRTHSATTADVKDSVLFIAPRICSALPVKSAVSVSPCTVSVTWIFTGGPPRPSLSM